MSGKGREPGGVVNDACAVQPPAFQGTNSRLEPPPGVLGAQISNSLARPWVNSVWSLRVHRWVLGAQADA